MSDELEMLPSAFPKSWSEFGIENPKGMIIILYHALQLQLIRRVE